MTERPTIILGPLFAAVAVDASTPAAMLLKLKGIGLEFATILHAEGLFRHFNNRRQVAAYAGLAPSPWNSGTIDHEQGVSKAGNPRLRTTMVELAWLWLRHQSASGLARWFNERWRAMATASKRFTGRETQPCLWFEVLCDFPSGSGDRRLAHPRAEVVVQLDPENIAFTGSAQGLFDIADAIHRIRGNPGKRHICYQRSTDHLNSQRRFGGKSYSFRDMDRADRRPSSWASTKRER